MSCFFRHQNLSRVFTPARSQRPAASSYVVCLDCGAEFEYDLATMRRGKKIFRGAERPDMVTLERALRGAGFPATPRAEAKKAGNATHPQPRAEIRAAEKVRAIR